MSEKNKNIKNSNIIFILLYFFFGGGGGIGISPRASNWLETALIVPSTMFKMYDPPNSVIIIRIISEFLNSKYDLRGRSRPISDQETRIYDHSDST